MRRLLVLLPLLGGCSDPYAPTGSGAYWLLDASNNVLRHPSAENVRLVGPEGLSPGDGKGFVTGSTILQHVFRRIKEGEQGPLRENGRFSIPAGQKVEVRIPGTFHLEFTAAEHPGDRVAIDYRFAWEGRPAETGRLETHPHSAIGFVRSKGDDRYALLLVMIGDLIPSLYVRDDSF